MRHKSGALQSEGRSDASTPRKAVRAVSNSSTSPNHSCSERDVIEYKHTNALTWLDSADRMPGHGTLTVPFSQIYYSVQPQVSSGFTVMCDQWPLGYDTMYYYM